MDWEIIYFFGRDWEIIYFFGRDWEIIYFFGRYWAIIYFFGQVLGNYLLFWTGIGQLFIFRKNSNTIYGTVVGRAGFQNGPGRPTRVLGPARPVCGPGRL